MGHNKAMRDFGHILCPENRTFLVHTEKVVYGLVVGVFPGMYI